MIIKLRKDLTVGIISTVLSVVLWFLIPIGITTKAHIVTNAVGPDYMPKLLCIVMFTLGIWLMVKSLVLKKDSVEEIDLSEEKCVILFLLSLMLVVLAMPIIGFLPSALLMSILSLIIFKEKHKLYWVIMAVMCCVIYALFKFALGVPLP
ncbi:MAG: tripartite tricarboxylate transporter TctB family protein [Angelakisella sp.]